MRPGRSTRAGKVSGLVFRRGLQGGRWSQPSAASASPSRARLTVALSSSQTEALQQLQKDSEAIRSQYAHYFDLSLVNNGVEETLTKLQEAFERACSSPQWVPVSWVY